jgi:hypothetical protein
VTTTSRVQNTTSPTTLPRTSPTTTRTAGSAAAEATTTAPTTDASTTSVLPAHLAATTFLEYNTKGRKIYLSLVRFSDGNVVRVVRTAPFPGDALLGAIHATNGDLLLAGCTPPACGRVPPLYLSAPFWRDVKTGKSYAGSDAAVSPDGRRIATLVTKPNREVTVRSYDFSTGRVLSNLLSVHAGDSSNGVTGIGWSGNSQSLFVATRVGVYLVPRDDRTLPDRPTVPNQVIDGFQTFFPEAAILANGHAVAFESTNIEHTAWPGALVDIDLATGTVRTIMGSTHVFPDNRTECGTANATNPCDLLVDNATISARGNDALFNNWWAGQIWLYDGNTARLICTHRVGATPTW